MSSPGSVSIKNDGVVLGDLDELAAAEVVLCSILKRQPNLLRYHRTASQYGNVLMRNDSRKVVAVLAVAQVHVSVCMR